MNLSKVRLFVICTGILAGLELHGFQLAGAAEDDTGKVFVGYVFRRPEKINWARQWDDETKNPWLLSPDRSVVIGYDDEEAVSIKTEWAMSKRFRGVFFWQIAADLLPDGTNPLQEASREKWQAHLTESP